MNFPNLNRKEEEKKKTKLRVNRFNCYLWKKKREERKGEKEGKEGKGKGTRVSVKKENLQYLDAMLSSHNHMQHILAKKSLIFKSPYTCSKRSLKNIVPSLSQ
jgi:hypothetical protein